MVPFPDNLTAVLFSGGDAPGMNALLRALVRLARNRYALDVLGIRDGYKGLARTAKRLASGAVTLDELKASILEHQGSYGLLEAEQDLILMDKNVVSGIVVQGGIQLRSARCKEFQDKPELRRQIIEMLRALGVKNLIVCGGNGSLAGARCLEQEGDFKVVGVPATIDNDLPVTEMALGVQSAVASVVWAVDHFKDTARSHRRVMVLEVMGRKSGELTQMAALASGAEYALIPEKGRLTHDRILNIAKRIETDMKKGRTHTIVLIAEGVEFEPETSENPAHRFAKALEDCFEKPTSPNDDVEIEVRPSVLGHLQRGGRPAPGDAILAAQFAEAAWEAIIDSRVPSVIVVQRDGKIQRMSFDESAAIAPSENWKKNANLQKALSGW